MGEARYKQNTLKRELPMSVERFYSSVIEESGFQRKFQESHGDEDVQVGDWSSSVGCYERWGNDDCNPVAEQSYSARRTLTFQTPLKLPFVLKKIIGAASSAVTIQQYLVHDEAQRSIKMWSDVSVSGVPLADNTGVQFGIVISAGSREDECILELTAKSRWIGKSTGKGITITVI